MSDDGVPLAEKFSIITDARTLHALLRLVQRVPMTDLEAVAVEDIFGGWFEQLRSQSQAQRDALAAIAAMVERVPPAEPPTLEEVAAQLDQIDQPEPGAAAGDVLTHASPPDDASGLVPYEGDERIVG